MLGLMIVAVWFALVAAFLVRQWWEGELAFDSAESVVRPAGIGVRRAEWGVRDSAPRTPHSRPGLPGSVLDYAGSVSR